MAGTWWRVARAERVAVDYWEGLLEPCSDAKSGLPISDRLQGHEPR